MMIGLIGLANRISRILLWAALVSDQIALHDDGANKA
ncbi:hypothetical protein LYNGBM3L_72220 [Moorena producens 3L]|uniref:Uncharacterized protein n=1 Tax=Moorena producens 3L TaxID=489825 RepID=F4Y3D1_9CYAN|nr:hypothetical protein LYNGBM3L_72220 [Moorena producens 3L]